MYCFHSTILFVVALAVHAQAACVLRGTPPSHHVCGLHGLVSYPHGYNDYSSDDPVEQTTSSLDDCIDLAFFGQDYDYGYEALYYDITSELCAFFTSGFAGKNSYQPFFTADNSSDLIFYHRKCFDCTPDCPLPTDGTNLVYDGGFELSPTLYGPWINNAPGMGPPPKLISPGSNSQTCIQPAGDEPYEETEGSIVQYRHICYSPSQLFYFKFDYYFNVPAKAGGYDSELYFSGLGLAGELSWSNATHKGTWQTLVYSGKSDQAFINKQQPDQSVSLLDPYFFVRTWQDYQLYLDNIEITAIPGDSFPPATTGQNLLQNPGFESGQLAPWTATNLTIVPASDLYDNTSQGNKYALGTRKFTSSLSQTIGNLVPGATYLASFDYKGGRPMKSYSQIVFSQGSVSWTDKHVQNHLMTTEYWVFTAINSSVVFSVNLDYFRHVTVDNFAIKKLV